ncbi:carbon-nitrogen family hydrolase [Lutibacter sp. B2]|nr:carbon-nitrogen family hydrolase [Lutibacter sp. B2]
MMRISIVQMDIEFSNPEKNREKAIEMIEKAAKEKPDVIVLPEMWNTSFSFENINDIADEYGEPTKTIMRDLCVKHNVNIIAGSIADKHGEDIYNRAYVIDRKGNIKAYYDKVHLVRHAKENTYMKRGENATVFEIDGVKCGIVLCYDFRFPELVRTMALQGAKILFVPAQWFETRLNHWEVLACARALENQMYVVGVNRIGKEYKATFPGKSLVVDPWGNIVKQANGDETVMTVDIDLGLVERVRKKITCFLDRSPEVYKL